MNQCPNRQVRAFYTNKIIRVYQAYSHLIADTALENGTFVTPPFKMERMTWIKPSFFWMMYRCGWGEKEGQERVLAIDIRREGFEWALEHSCLSKFIPSLDKTEEDWLLRKKKSPVRIQWDPERDMNLNRLDHKSIQIGLSGEAVVKYVNEWIVNIRDITSFARKIKSLVQSNQLSSSIPDEFPLEREYPVPPNLARIINAS